MKKAIIVAAVLSAMASFAHAGSPGCSEKSGGGLHKKSEHLVADASNKVDARHTPVRSGDAKVDN